MRLLIITQYFWPEDFRVNELVRELSGRGHEITVLTGKPNYPDGVVFADYAVDPARFATYAGARVIRVPMLARGRGIPRLLLNYVTFAVSATLVGWMRIRNAAFDAIFVFEPSPITVGLPAVAFRALRGWPVAFWVLDQWPESLAAVGMIRSRRLLALVGALVRAIYTRCDLILSPSRLLVPQIATYCRAGQKIEYLPNWSESAYQAVGDSRAPEVPPSAGGFSVMFAGNIGEAQDFPAILDAAERLRGHPEVRWLIVGEGRMAAWVRAEIDRRGLSDCVIMLGRFPADRMPSLFLHADALLVSLKKDPVFTMTAPGKLQSYLSAGRPVVAMLDGEGASVVEEARAGVTGPAGDGARLAANVLGLASLPAGERAAMGARGMSYALREFSRVALVDRLEKWLGAMIASTHAHGPA